MEVIASISQSCCKNKDRGVRGTILCLSPSKSTINSGYWHHLFVFYCYSVPCLCWLGVQNNPSSFQPLVVSPLLTSLKTSLFMSLLGLKNVCRLLASSQKILHVTLLDTVATSTCGYSAHQLWLVQTEMYYKRNTHWILRHRKKRNVKYLINRFLSTTEFFI